MRTKAPQNPRERTPKSPDNRGPSGQSQWIQRSCGGLTILEAPSLAHLDWLVHGFSTRLGGASEFPSPGPGRAGTPEHVLNLGFTDWDSRARVAENRSRLLAALGAEEMRTITLRQTHSDIVHQPDGSRLDAAAQPALGDALITREPGLLLTVQTADCVPILLADTRVHAVAAIHAGWRGTLKRITEKTLGRMRMEFGTQPEDALAAIGPAIGGCCYEVGHEVAKEFAAQFPNAKDWFDGPFARVSSGDDDPNWLPWLTMAPPGHAPQPPRVHLDLIAANRDILAAAGVPLHNISLSSFCTACRTDLFFSYRRERTTGRLMAAIGILSVLDPVPSR